jgi:NitT/TauT family transport system substrate-binding protein
MSIERFPDFLLQPKEEPSMTKRSDHVKVKLSRREMLLGTTLAAASTVAMPWVRKAGAADLEKFKMCSWSPRLAEEGNIFVSEAKGFFKDEGLEIEWIPGAGSGVALTNMIAGNGDIAFVGPEALYLATDKGSKLKAIYDLYPNNAFNVFALKNKQIITPYDLKGKKIGVISMGSGTRYNLATILALHGMSESDVELVALGLNAAPAIIDGKVDAMASTDTILYGMQASGLGAVDVLWARDYLNSSTDLFVIEEKNYEPKKDFYTRFLRGYRKGMEYTIKNPQEAAEITAKVAIDGKDPIKVMGSLKLRILTSQNAATRAHGLGWIDIAPLQECAKIYKSAGFIKDDIDVTKLVTNDLVMKI